MQDWEGAGEQGRSERPGAGGGLSTDRLQTRLTSLPKAVFLGQSCPLLWWAELQAIIRLPHQSWSNSGGGMREEVPAVLPLISHLPMCRALWNGGRTSRFNVIPSPKNSHRDSLGRSDHIYEVHQEVLSARQLIR